MTLLDVVNLVAMAIGYLVLVVMALDLLLRLLGRAWVWKKGW